MQNFVEKIFWINDQLRLKTWQEPRLYHSIQLEAFTNKMYSQLDRLAKAYMKGEFKVATSEVLFRIENDIEINFVLKEIRDFLDYVKTEPEGWEGSMQKIIDETLAEVDIFSNTINKE